MHGQHAGAAAQDHAADRRIRALGGITLSLPKAVSEPEKMSDPAISPTVLLTALALAEEHGSARAALRVTGWEPDELECLQGLPRNLATPDGIERSAALDEALSLGFLAGRAADRQRRPHAFAVSSFLMDHDLVVRGAEGRSILKLPWFNEDLFIARQLPDITEMPRHVRALAVENYRAALRGTRRHFEFISYGHRYNVDAVPVRAHDGVVIGALALARDASAPEEASRLARLTPREIEILQLAADGMSGPQIAEHLVLSPGTVKTHFQNIYAKSGASERSAAVAMAMRHGLIR
jgi:DNA-binding CsgD family transcriptional regulator